MLYIKSHIYELCSFSIAPPLNNIQDIGIAQDKKKRLTREKNTGGKTEYLLKNTYKAVLRR